MDTIWGYPVELKTERGSISVPMTIERKTGIVKVDIEGLRDRWKERRDEERIREIVREELDARTPDVPKEGG